MLARAGEVTRASDFTVSGLRFHSRTVRRDQFRGHHTETAESLGENVTLCKQMSIYHQLPIAQSGVEK
jgi:hypothetical protein